MKRTIRPEPEQLGLFETPAAARDNGRTSPSWIARHWPDYVASARQRPPVASALVLWAESITGLRAGTRSLLLALARQASGGRSCQICLPGLAQASGIARNTCRRHLDKLLTSGLVMVKPWTANGRIRLGYEFCLIVGDGDRDCALAEGFASRRVTAKATAIAAGFASSREGGGAASHEQKL